MVLVSVEEHAEGLENMLKCFVLRRCRAWGLSHETIPGEIELTPCLSLSLLSTRYFTLYTLPFTLCGPVQWSSVVEVRGPSRRASSPWAARFRPAPASTSHESQQSRGPRVCAVPGDISVTSFRRDAIYEKSSFGRTCYSHPFLYIRWVYRALGRGGERRSRRRGRCCGYFYFFVLCW